MAFVCLSFRELSVAFWRKQGNRLSFLVWVGDGSLPLRPRDSRCTSHLVDPVLLHSAPCQCAQTCLRCNIYFRRYYLNWTWFCFNLDWCYYLRQSIKSFYLFNVRINSLLNSKIKLPQKMYFLSVSGHRLCKARGVPETSSVCLQIWLVRVSTWKPVLLFFHEEDGLKPWRFRFSSEFQMNWKLLWVTQLLFCFIFTWMLMYLCWLGLFRL